MQCYLDMKNLNTVLASLAVRVGHHLEISFSKTFATVAITDGNDLIMTVEIEPDQSLEVVAIAREHKIRVSVWVPGGAYMELHINS